MFGARIQRAWLRDYPEARRKTFPGALIRVKPRFVTATEARSGKVVGMSVELERSSGGLSWEIVRRQLESGVKVPYKGQWLAVPFQDALKNPRVRARRFANAFVIERDGVPLLARRSPRGRRRSLEIMAVLVKRSYTKKGYNRFDRLVRGLDAELVKRFNAAWRDELRSALARGRISQAQFSELGGVR